MKRYSDLMIFILAIVVFGRVFSTAFAGTCLEYDGVDGDGVPATLTWCLAPDQDSAGQGIYKLYVNGMITTDTSDEVYITDSLGSESNAMGLRDIATAFLVANDTDLYVFFSEVSDYELIGAGTGYGAYLYDIRYADGSFRVRGWWYTVYLSMLDLIANEWFWTEPKEPLYLNLVTR